MADFAVAGTHPIGTHSRAKYRTGHKLLLLRSGEVVLRIGKELVRTDVHVGDILAAPIDERVAVASGVTFIRRRAQEDSNIDSGARIEVIISPRELAQMPLFPSLHEGHSLFFSQRSVRRAMRRGFC